MKVMWKECSYNMKIIEIIRTKSSNYKIRYKVLLKIKCEIIIW